jgi:hypothetical protein
MWRIFQSDMFGNSHTIVRLAVHLPMEEPVSFRPGQAEAAFFRAQNSKTTLTAWFKLNESDPLANDFLYHEIPKYYSWKKEITTWSKRVDGYVDVDKVIGRMYVVSPKEGERYYLRLLLLKVKGKFYSKSIFSAL